MGTLADHARLVVAKSLRAVEGWMWRGGPRAPPAPAVERTERTVPTCTGETTVTVHRPVEDADRSLPVFVTMHGGGFVLGSRTLDEDWCSAVADAVGCAVVNVEYVLAPEHRTPDPFEECYDVVSYLADRPEAFGVDRDRIAIGGHSAGAKIATSIALLAAERGDFSLVGQVLDCPPVDEVTDPVEKPSGPETTIHPRLAAFFRECLVGPDGDPTDPLVSPLYAEESRLREQPPALVITAEHDLLRREGTQYAERLAASGVPVTHHEAPDTTHMYPVLGTRDDATEAWDRICEHLSSVFGAGDAVESARREEGARA